MLAAGTKQSDGRWRCTVIATIHALPDGRVWRLCGGNAQNFDRARMHCRTRWDAMDWGIRYTKSIIQQFERRECPERVIRATPSERSPDDQELPQQLQLVADAFQILQDSSFMLYRVWTSSMVPRNAVAPILYAL